MAATVVLGVIAYRPSVDSAESAKKQTDVAASEASRLPNLQVMRTLAYLKDDLSGTYTYGLDKPEKQSGLRGPHIDVTFENRANGPALITKASLKFREMGHVETCGAVGGDLEISVNYDFPIPHPLPSVPYLTEKDISFQVGTNELDRLTLTTGPETVAGRPWYGVADVILEHDGGKKQVVGPVALIDTGSDEHFYPDFDQDRWVINVDDRACLQRTADLTSRLLSTPGVIAAKELKSLRETLNGLGY
ncbi:hypothetical protein ACIRVN_07100 [Streptomyces albogriseolus]|uniref:hypothetical protein n=1 Tax=Streptomyces albogriseolus TaxID=1887 RepID=UPI0037F62C26